MRNNILNQWQLVKLKMKRNKVACSIFFILSVFISTQSEAFCVYNQTDYLVNFTIAKYSYKANKVGKYNEATKTPANCWHYSAIGNGSRTQVLTVEVHIDAIQFNAVISMQAGGYIKVQYIQEENEVGRTVRVLSYTYYDGVEKIIDSKPHVSNPGKRDVEFLATADPQFVKDDIDDKTKEWWRATAVLMKLKTETVSGANRFRGVIVAGDLTQWTRTVEFQEYEKPFQGFTRYLYDGLGNHDYGFGNGDIHKGNCCNGSGSLRGGNLLAWNNSCICPDAMAKAIGERLRSSALTGRSGPNYSWDWHDVHFVQLNLYPGNGSKFSHKIGSDSYSYNTFNSLDFLIQDLAKNVGNSGRPVVLIHHYGFEGFSRGCSPNELDTNKDGCTSSAWWTQADRIAYWNVIANYNVPLIITGHLHETGGVSWWQTKWKRPAGLSNGPAEIQAITAGGAKHGGYYTTFKMDNNEIMADRFQLEMKEPFIISHTFKKVGTVKIPVTQPGARPAHVPSPNPTPVAGFKRIQNRWKTDQYLHIENGPIKVGPLGKPDWWSAQWELVPVSGTNFVQIKNRWKPTIYLHNQNGAVEAGPLGAPGWWSAQWELVPVSGTNFVQIKNRWKPTIYLHNQNGAIEAGPLGAPGWWSAQWKLE
jgi:hypothetical protein